MDAITNLKRPINDDLTMNTTMTPIQMMNAIAQSDVDLFLPSPPKMGRQISVQVSKPQTTPEIFKEELNHRIVSGFPLTQTLPMVNMLDPDRKPLDSTIILDETGSMETMGREPMEAVNEYIKEQRDSGLPVTATLIKFNSTIKVVYEDKPITEDANIKQYEPSGMTALNDTIRYAILTAKTPRAIVIVTDGQDNLSITAQSETNALIERATALGWVFTFIGCTFEAMQQASIMPPSMRQHSSNQSEGAPSLLQTMRGVSNSIGRYNQLANSGATQEELDSVLM
jgi:hypothetical protein